MTTSIKSSWVILFIWFANRMLIKILGKIFATNPLPQNPNPSPLPIFAKFSDQTHFLAPVFSNFAQNHIKILFLSYLLKDAYELLCGQILFLGYYHRFYTQTHTRNDKP